MVLYNLLYWGSFLYKRKEILPMGKSLKGKELGVGISQRKDGLYTARFVDKLGKRRQKYFKKLQDCRNWLADAQFEDEHGNVLQGENPTVDAWYNYWIDNVKGDNIRFNTRRNYNERYERNIKPLIGDMFLKEVKPLHCQNVLNQMSDKYANSVIGHSRLVMWMLFDSAVENELLSKNPVTKSVKCTSGRNPKEMRALTIEEQKIFLETISGTSNYNQYAFLLQTGLRTGEMIGLRWSDVDFENCVEFKDSIFLCINGTPTKNSAYDTKLFYYCDKAGIPRFSMHVLRHTFATRCIENGMRPKTLQMILGHSNIGITMNLYVHVTDDEKVKEVQNIEKMLKIV